MSFIVVTAIIATKKGGKVHECPTIMLDPDSKTADEAIAEVRKRFPGRVLSAGVLKAPKRLCK